MQPQYVTLYQIYDQQGNKKLEPFHVYESAVYMTEFCNINGIIEEIEMPITEFLNKGN